MGKQSTYQEHVSTLQDVSGGYHHLQLNKERNSVTDCVSLSNYKALHNFVLTSKAEIVIIVVINGSKMSFQIYSSHILWILAEKRRKKNIVSL